MHRKTTVTTLNYGHAGAVAQTEIVLGWPHYRNRSRMGSIAGSTTNPRKPSTRLLGPSEKNSGPPKFPDFSASAFHLLWRAPRLKPARLQRFLRRRGIGECITCRRRRRKFRLERPSAHCTHRPFAISAIAPRWHLRLHGGHDDTAELQPDPARRVTRERPDASWQPGPSCSAGRVSGCPDRLQKLADLVPEAVAVARQRLRRRQHL
jgi:hypothetical protein